MFREHWTMTDRQSVVVLRRQREQEDAGLDDNLSDQQLLERFVCRHEQAAFAALVRRHGSSVLGVCRRVLRNEHDAEDAFQAVFFVLARKAGVVGWQESLRPWLQAVAHRLALHARHATRRRSGERTIESLDSEVSSSAAALPERYHSRGDLLREVEQRELRRVLTDEVSQLPEKYREPVVLCYLQGKTNEAAARELGWPAGSISRRLARARDLLRERLIRRGLTLSLVFLVLTLLALWVLRGGLRTSGLRHEEMPQATRSFKPAPHDVRGLETILLRLAEDGRFAAGTDREQLADMARQTAESGERLQRQDPGRRQREWRRSAEEMYATALGLARSLDKQDDPSALLGARHLHASCRKCHEIFRE
jgi:RNA polymerase sigma-70 factor (ECF subfamily)